MTERGRPLVVGEVLYDEMPDGARVLGGAPFNVAWHLEAFGLRPLVITRVGADDSGDDVLAAMAAWGLETSGVQRDNDHRTGRVKVELEDGDPTFHILPEQAYDFLDRDEALQSMAGEDLRLVYHGSLISREEVSHATLDSIVQAADLPVFVDVNLRDPWWNHGKVVAAVRRARWVKVNEAELGLLAGGPDPATAEAFLSDHGLDTLIVTRGDRGALVVDSSGTAEVGVPGKVEVVDTVGAGDAFSSVFILGLMMGWPSALTLERALDFAAAVCTLSGATTEDRSLYSRFECQGWW